MLESYVSDKGTCESFLGIGCEEYGKVLKLHSVFKKDAETSSNSGQPTSDIGAIIDDHSYNSSDNRPTNI